MSLVLLIGLDLDMITYIVNVNMYYTHPDAPIAIFRNMRRMCARSLSCPKTGNWTLRLSGVDIASTLRVVPRAFLFAPHVTSAVRPLQP
jgi:hypothetical protein